MLFARKTSQQNEQPGAYAKPTDFAQLFICDMRSLYFLALLLAGDFATADRCFLSALDTCGEEAFVVRQWAAAWCRRSVIKSAIKIISPSPFKRGNRIPAGHAMSAESAPEFPLRSVQNLPAFDRFVFVMSVLERYSMSECTFLLNCSASDVCSARIRALKQIAATGHGKGIGQPIVERHSSSNTLRYFEARVA